MKCIILSISLLFSAMIFGQNKFMTAYTISKASLYVSGNDSMIDVTNNYVLSTMPYIGAITIQKDDDSTGIMTIDNGYGTKPIYLGRF
ncbi:MAG: hypothetical protein H0W84_02305 [Bacteroidetes bacterium]|nr:hypothetical protein [Bacteroidota bacterium]